MILLLETKVSMGMTAHEADTLCFALGQMSEKAWLKAGVSIERQKVIAEIYHALHEHLHK